MLPLDADSLMDGATIVRLARIMEAHPKLGILQSLVVGLPSQSAFARLFQFGMRQGMRPYTMGSAWWAGDCGPFWGHNAMVRIAPFAEHCHLPVLPGQPPLGGHILSHDQVEATLMRKAGYEVRVLPQECGSWEENPPTVLEFTRRDLRWCQGNMQYFKLLGFPGLLPMSRFQLTWAILMFLGIPAWTLMFALAALKPFETADLAAGYPAKLALFVYLAFLGMYLAPKIAGALDVVLTKGGLARYGGGVQFTSSFVIELAFSFLVGAATTLRTTMFMIGLIFGKSVIWSGQERDAHRPVLVHRRRGPLAADAVRQYRHRPAGVEGSDGPVVGPAASRRFPACHSIRGRHGLTRLWPVPRALANLRHPGRDRYAAGGSGPRGRHCNAVVQGGLTGDGLARAVCHGSSFMALDPDLSSRP